MRDFDALLKELQQLGHQVEDREDSRALIQLEGRGSTVVLLAIDDWLQVASVLVELAEIRGKPGESALVRSLLQVNGRYLGCRFALDDDGLCICSDVYPEHVSGQHVSKVMEQVDYVSSSLLPLFESCLATGRPVSDAEVDAAFAADAKNQFPFDRPSRRLVAS